MGIIRFNGVQKVKGRPTVVGGPQGRRYVADKILKGLEGSRPGAGQRDSFVHQRSDFERDGYLLTEDEAAAQNENTAESEYGLDDQGLTEESLTEGPNNPTLICDEVNEDGSFDEGFSIQRVRKAARDQENSQQISACEQSSAEDEADEDYYDYPDATADNAPRQQAGPPAAPTLMDYWAPVDKDRALQPATAAEYEEYHNTEETDVICAGLELPQEEFGGDGKTGILRIPKAGVVRSSRGTVEMLVHANGRTFKPQYNKCGVLLSVAVSDGFKFVKNVNKNDDWLMLDTAGNIVEPEAITAVAFDKKGNLWYKTAAGRKVTFFMDGSTESKSPKK